MKARKTVLFLAFLSVVVLFSCQKSRYCFCTTDETDPIDTIVINTDRSLKCKHFMQVGREELIDGSTQRTYHTYTCVQLDKDTVPTIPNLPVEE